MKKDFFEKTKEFAERTAYISKDEHILYNELFDRAQNIFGIIKTGDFSPVIIHGERKANVMASIIACLYAKRAYVPVEPDFPKERFEKIKALSGAGLMLDCTCDEINFINIENGAHKQSDNETAYIIFTSGSTGEPKGVPISCENLENFADWINSVFAFSGEEENMVLNHASFSFDLSTAAIYYSLMNGKTLVQTDPKESPEEIFETIRKNKINIIIATPTFMRLCHLDKSFCEKEFPFIKTVFFCGEPLQKPLVQKLFERFPEIQIINAYGPTEATCAVCSVEITKDMTEHEELLPVGETSLAAVDITEENGELVLKGKSVFDGYLSGIKGGYYNEDGVNCYRTGDIGFIRNGLVYCRGRMDSQIKYKGYRIELSDIETNLSIAKGVESCAVTARKDAQGEVKLIKAFYSGTPAEDEIRGFLSEKLPGYMVPKVIKKLEKLPVNKNGKIDRRELEQL